MISSGLINTLLSKSHIKPLCRLKYARISNRGDFDGVNADSSVHGSADMTAMQQSQSDEEQPDANNTTLRIWSNGNQTTGLILAVLMTRTMKKISGTAKVQAVPSPWTLNLP